MNPLPSVLVVVPTVLDRDREALIHRAIESATSQAGVDARVVLVVNGSRFDPMLLKSLQQLIGIQVRQISEGNVSLARFHGLEGASCDYFGFLDDDDELLPGTLLARVEALRCHPEWDVVVTNGYIRDQGDQLLIDAGLREKITTDQIGSFLDINWFASPASMFRTSRFDKSFFQIQHRNFEWTYLFWRLIGENYRIGYSDTVGYRKYEDHAGAVSKSDAYQLAYADFLQELERLPLPDRARAGIRRKRVIALNRSCDFYLARGERQRALRALWGCIYHGGWRYIPKLRRFVGLPWRSRTGSGAH